MANLVEYESDIFISYAHVDDEPVNATDLGWVTSFVRGFKVQLGRKLGRNDAFKLWMDHGLHKSEPVTVQILESVRRSAILVILLSPGYIASPWCRQELAEFLNIIRGRAESNVFIVEIDCTEGCQHPPELSDRDVFRFWVRDPVSGAPHTLGWPRPTSNDHEYYSAVDDLVHQIVEALRRLGHAATSHDASAAAPPTSGASMNGFVEPQTGFQHQSTVYLAQVTDDLDIERNNVRRFLEQAGLRVVPRGWYSLDAATFRRSAAADIATADLFVQLLSGVTGKRPPDLTEGYAKCQLQLALDASKPVLQWRGFSLDPATVEDEAQRTMLESPTVRAEGIEDFKEAVRHRIDELRQPPPKKSSSQAFVFVDMDSSDRPLAEKVCDILDRNGAGYVLPAQTDDPGEYRRDLEENFASCNALIVIYGSTTATWVRNHLLESRKAFARRALPPRALAVFQGPPAPKGQLPVKFPSMTVLDCQQGVDEAVVLKFLQSLDEQPK